MIDNLFPKSEVKKMSQQEWNIEIKRCEEATLYYQDQLKQYVFGFDNIKNYWNVRLFPNWRLKP